MKKKKFLLEFSILFVLLFVTYLITNSFEVFEVVWGFFQSVLIASIIALVSSLFRPRMMNWLKKKSNNWSN